GEHAGLRRDAHAPRQPLLGADVVGAGRVVADADERQPRREGQPRDARLQRADDLLRGRLAVHEPRAHRSSPSPPPSPPASAATGTSPSRAAASGWPARRARTTLASTPLTKRPESSPP